MTIQKAIEHFQDQQRTSLKKRTQEGYKKLLECFQSEFSDRCPNDQFMILRN
jgi:hypothetical protein